MYSQGPSYKTKPNDMSDPYETKFTARTLNDTAQVRKRRGFWKHLSSSYSRTDHPGNRKREFIHQG